MTVQIPLTAVLCNQSKCKSCSFLCLVPVIIGAHMHVELALSQPPLSPKAMPLNNHASDPPGVFKPHWDVCMHV